MSESERSAKYTDYLFTSLKFIILYFVSAKSTQHSLSSESGVHWILNWRRVAEQLRVETESESVHTMKLCRKNVSKIQIDIRNIKKEKKKNPPIISQFLNSISLIRIYCVFFYVAKHQTRHNRKTKNFLVYFTWGFCQYIFYFY